MKFYPTGNITLENINEFLSLPIVSNVGCTWLATQQQISGKNWSRISRQGAEALAKINQRSGLC